MKNIDLSLYLVTDKSDNVEKFLRTIEEAIKGGGSMPACLSMDCSAAGKAKSAAGVAAIYAEAYRHTMPSGREYTENVVKERSHKNVYWQNPRWQSDGYIPDWRRAIDTLRNERTPKGKKQRKIGADAVLVRTMIFQVSPVHFFPELETWSQRDIDLSK